MKWFGQIGFAVQSENETGITTEEVVVRGYYGDVIKAYKHDENNQINLNFTVRNRISVLADPFAMNTFHSIAFITFMGAKWRVSGVEVQYPRLLIELGDVYKQEIEEEGEETNGEQT